MSADSSGIPQHRWQAEAAFLPAILASALLVSIAVWFFADTGFDLRPTLRTLLVGSVAVIVLLQVSRVLAPAIRRCLPYLLSIVLLLAVWSSLGAPLGSGFLILFSLPVFAAAFVSRGWLEYLLAATAIAGVVVEGARSNDRLRWQLEQLEVLPTWLLPRTSAPEAGWTAVSAYDDQALLTLLVTFAAATLAVAIVGSQAARELRSLHRGLGNAQRARDESEAIAQRLLSSSEHSEFLVERSSGRIVADGNPAEDGTAETILDVLQPVYPEPIGKLLDTRRPARLEGVICRPDATPVLYDIDVESVVLDGRPLRHFSVIETPGHKLVRSAIDELALGLAIIGPDFRIAFASRMFRQLFPEATPGTAATLALESRFGLPTGWWDIMPSRFGRVRLRDGDQNYVISLQGSGEHDSGALTFLRVRKLANTNLDDTMALCDEVVE